MKRVFIRTIVDMNDCIFPAANNTVPYHNLVDNLKVKHRVSKRRGGARQIDECAYMRVEWSGTVARRDRRKPRRGRCLHTP